MIEEVPLHPGRLCRDSSLAACREWFIIIVAAIAIEFVVVVDC